MKCKFDWYFSVRNRVFQELGYMQIIMRPSTESETDIGGCSVHTQSPTHSILHLDHYYYRSSLAETQRGGNSWVNIFSSHIIISSCTRLSSVLANKKKKKKTSQFCNCSLLLFCLCKVLIHTLGISLLQSCELVFLCLGY